MDTLLKFVTGFYENGVIVVEKSEILKHYLRKGLKFDLMAYIPVLAQGVLRNYVILIPYIDSTVIRVAQILLFCKVKRVAIALGNFEEITSSHGRDDYKITAIRLMFTILFFTHLNACIWHALAFYGSDQNNWLTANHLMSQAWKVRYYISLHWAISIFGTLGYGDNMSPRNIGEYAISSMSILVSIFLFCYAFFTISSIFKGINREKEKYKEGIKVMNGYMNRNGLSFELQAKIRKYLEYIFKKSNDDRKEDEILEKLNKKLRREVVMETYGKMLFKTPYLNANFSRDTLSNLAFFMKTVTHSPEEYIYKEKKLDEQSLYILEKGDVYEASESIKKGGSPILLRKINPGETFGLYSFFSGEARVTSILSKGFSSVFEIKKKDFLAIARTNLNDYQRFCEIRDKIQLMKDFRGLIPVCPSCKSPDHLCSMCDATHFVPNRDFIIRRHNFSQPQARSNMTFPRRSHKFRTRANLTAVQEAARFLDRDSEEEFSSPMYKSTVSEYDGGKFTVKENETDDEEEGMMMRKTRVAFQEERGKDEESKGEEEYQIGTLPIINGKMSMSVKKESKAILPSLLLGNLRNGAPKITKKGSLIIKTLSNLNLGEDPAEMFLYDFEEASNFKRYFVENNKDKVLAKKGDIKKTRTRRRQFFGTSQAISFLENKIGTCHYNDEKV